MRILIVLGLPILTIIAVFAMVNMRAEPAKKEIVDIKPLVEVVVAEPMTANFEVHSQGTVKPRTETILSSEVSGTVTSISPQFVAGGFFKANDVLMRIDPTNYETALKQAEAIVLQRKIEYDGAKQLRSQGYRAESEYASAAAAQATAEAELVRARRNLRRTYIRLPYDGIVRAKEADLGQFVNMGTRLGVVFATDTAEVRLPLTDLDLAFVDLPDAGEEGGAQAAVTLSAVRKGKATEWPAVIVRTEGVVDENSRVTYAVASIEDPYQLQSEHEALPVGTFVAARIKGSSADNVYRVPRSVVRGSNELVLVNSEGELQLRNVGIVRADTDYVYVGNGISAGEQIVLTALESPVNGMRVRSQVRGEQGE